MPLSAKPVTRTSARPRTRLWVEELESPLAPVILVNTLADTNVANPAVSPADSTS